MLKKIDIYILKSYIGPYLLAFFIAEFVLVMQFLWKYVDEILGKGYSFFEIIEMIFYFTVTLIPMALPISILLSSVMVFGSLSEKYELSSFKSAGVSLIRIMRPGLILAIGTFLFSLLASNYLKPQANFNFQSRLLSIRMQKASLVIEEKIFENDFENFIIRVDSKDDDDRTIHDVMVYDHSTSDKSLLNLTKAKDGLMYTDTTTQNFVLELFDGVQYSELKREYDKEGRRSYPMMRTSFSRWRKEFDLSAFNTGSMSGNMNRRKEDMMSAIQLYTTLDSLHEKKAKTFEKVDTVSYRYKVVEPSPYRSVTVSNQGSSAAKDTLKLKAVYPDTIRSVADLMVDNAAFEMIKRDASQMTTILRERLRSANSSAYATQRNINKYQLRLHQQFSFAMICIVFLFLGAPLGSIIRKGGFGYPLLYAILFYMLFMLMAIMGEKLIRNDDLDPILSAWLPNIVIAPIAIWFTIRALRDKTTFFW